MDDATVVLRSPDQNLILIARSVLDGAGIPFVVKGEGIQDIIGGGRIGGMNFLTGPIEILVPDDRAEEARAILADFDQEASDS